MGDTREIDEALIAVLAADAALMAIAVDGVHWALAPPGSTRYVIVDRIVAGDAYVMGATAWEQITYVVKAVIKDHSRVAAADAAQRIYVLLHNAPLVITGYGHMQTLRDEPIEVLELDEDTGQRWQHHGGRYLVWAGPH